MGDKSEVNWALKLEEGLEELTESLIEGGEDEFKKEGKRIYPIDVPLLLADKDWNILAAVRIMDYKTYDNKTKGIYKVIRIFNEEDRKTLTRIYRELYAKSF